MNDRFADEMLNDDELDQVTGGTQAENNVDRAFFSKLGYDMNKMSLNNAWSANGIHCIENNYSNNRYSSQSELQEYSHLTAMGYVLHNEKYPGFDSRKLFDNNYVRGFIKENFGINA